MNKPLQLPNISQQIDQGLHKAYEAMLAFKRYKHTPVIIVRDGKVVAVAPDELPPAASKAA